MTWQKKQSTALIFEEPEEVIENKLGLLLRRARNVYRESLRERTHSRDIEEVPLPRRNPSRRVFPASVWTSAWQNLSADSRQSASRLFLRRKLAKIELHPAHLPRA